MAGEQRRAYRDGAARRAPRASAPLSTVWPAYITVISSHSWATTPKSCVTNSMRDAELVGQRLQQLEDLQLRRDVERRGRLVGDHAATGCRRARRRSSGAGAGRRRTGADSARARPRARGSARGAAARHEVVRARAPRSVRRRGRVPAQDREQLGADAEHRIERQIGVLRDEADAAGRGRARSARARRESSRFSPSNRISPLSIVAGVGQDAEDGARQRGLAAAGFADHAEDVPARQRSAARDRGSAPMPSSVRTERRRFFDLEQRRGAHRDRLSRGSTMSRRPSPSRLKPSTVRKIASPGKVENHQASGR